MNIQRPAEIVPQHIHDAALVVARSDRDFTDWFGIYDDLRRLGFVLDDRELTAVIGRARAEREADTFRSIGELSAQLVEKHRVA